MLCRFPWLDSSRLLFYAGARLWLRLPTSLRPSGSGPNNKNLWLNGREATWHSKWRRNRSNHWFPNYLLYWSIACPVAWSRLAPGECQPIGTESQQSCTSRILTRLYSFLFVSFSSVFSCPNWNTILLYLVLGRGTTKTKGTQHRKAFRYRHTTIPWADPIIRRTKQSWQRSRIRQTGGFRGEGPISDPSRPRSQVANHRPNRKSHDNWDLTLMSGIPLYESGWHIRGDFASLVLTLPSCSRRVM